MQYGLLGEKLGHSFSPQIHSALGARDYGLIEIAQDKLEQYMTSKEFSAINVTIPYKQSVIPFCDCLSESAQAIGAVNTIVNRAGKLHGYNTDFAGFLYMAQRAGIDFADKKVLILGSGGTSKTASFAVNSKAAKSVHIVSRGGEVNYQNAHILHSDADIIVNTTPIGMFPNCDAVPINLDLFPQLCGVLDVIYNPLTTRLVSEARSRGICAVNGLSMLVAQAKFAEELFFDRAIADAVCDKLVSQIDSQMRNIVLCGMPSCGKSSIGKTLARVMGRELIDIDECIVKKAGISIPEIFATFGETYFRRLESEVVASQCNFGSRIISLGGGSVLREDNRRAIRQNGYVVYLTRPIEDLVFDGRPLSTDRDALYDMYVVRHPIYREVSDLVCENGSTKMAVANKIIKNFFERSV